MSYLNATHDPSLRCWLPSAHAPGTDFPIQNLPFGVFRPRGTAQAWRCGVAIGDAIIDLPAVAPALPADGAQQAAAAGAAPALNDLMALGPAAWHALRRALSQALRTDAPESLRQAVGAALVPQAQAEFALPVRVGDYTDFYTSVHHATNIGRLFRPDNPLLPNYKWVPIGYHGRASSLIVSGHDFRRPQGQTLPPGAQQPVFGPSRRLDIELEMAVYIGTGNALGEPVPLDQAEPHVFGLSLLNDWSARDIQAWEYQPLGPFLSKNFATSVSPWVVTLEALAPFRAPLLRPAEDPQPLPYLDSADNRAAGSLDIQLEALLQTPRMRESGAPPSRLCLTNYRHAYWTLAQMVSHHTVNGCNLQTGDLLGTGTLSGPEPTQAAALIELTQGGRQPITLAGGEQRTWLEDGDTVELRGWCERSGAVRIGFGACVATVLPASGAASASTPESAPPRHPT